MAYKLVTEYHLTYDIRPNVWVKLEGESFLHLIQPATGEAVFVADMLRNEKPMYYDSAQKVLSTSAEEIGEEET